jgi:uncharacterized membrane protein
MNPLMSVTGTIVTGLILAVLISFGIAQVGSVPIHLSEPGLLRWAHILSGIMWIGLLYYFNVVQVPGLTAAAADKGGPGSAGVVKYIAPRALLWFRWAAVATWLTGALALVNGQRFMSALTLGHGGQDQYGLIIGLGMWIGSIMLFNVWVLIWPNQSKILGLVPATDAEKAKARKVGLLASRTNFALSIPLIMCMGSAAHGLPF